MRIVDAGEVHRLCGWTELAASLAALHRKGEPLSARSELHFAGAKDQRDSFINLPAWLPGVALGLKSITVFPGNNRLPAVQAVYLLFDGETGEPQAMIDGTAMTYRKTAADSALGSQLLSAPDAHTLLMVGAGALAPYLIDAHRAVRPSIGRVLVWNRDAAKATKLAEACGGMVSALEAGVREADIICCATASTHPLVEGRWLKPGAHLDLVGGFTPDMRECDDEAVRRARLFVDSFRYGVDQPGDLGDPLRRGVIARDKIEADLFGLCGKDYAVNRKQDDITLFKNGGGGHLDLFTALHIRQNLN